jgi:hypothetical protein
MQLSGNYFNHSGISSSETALHQLKSESLLAMVPSQKVPNSTEVCSLKSSVLDD